MANIHLTIQGTYSATLNGIPTTINDDQPLQSSSWYNIQVNPGNTITMQFSEDFDSLKSYLNFFGCILVSGGENAKDATNSATDGGAGGSTLQINYNNFIKKENVLKFTSGTHNENSVFSIDDKQEAVAGFNKTINSTNYSLYINNILNIDGGEGGYISYDGRGPPGTNVGSNWPTNNIFNLYNSFQPDFTSTIALASKYGGGGRGAYQPQGYAEYYGGSGGDSGNGGNAFTSNVYNGGNGTNGGGGGGAGGVNMDDGSAWLNAGKGGIGGEGIVYIYFYVSNDPIEYEVYYPPLTLPPETAPEPAPAPAPAPGPPPIPIKNKATAQCTPLQVYGGPQPTRSWSREEIRCPNPNGDPNYFNQLDERRKAEIFKYTKNANQMSKKQMYANIARGRSYAKKQTWATQSLTYTNPNVQNLPRVGNILRCNRSSNVRCAMSYDNNTPGPPTQICLDPNVPLYNYKTQAFF